MVGTFTNPRWWALPCERMRACVFAEDFVTEEMVEYANVAITGSPTFDNGVTLDGTSDYLTYTVYSEIFNSANITIIVEFYPDFDWDDDRYYYFFDTQSGKRYLLAKKDNAGNNTLLLYLGNTAIASVTPGTYVPYWNVGERNVIAVAGTTGNTSMWLNGTKILDADNTAWTPTDPTQFTVGVRYNGDTPFDGIISKVRVFQNVLTEEEISHYYDDDLTSFIDSPYACWRCDSTCDDSDANKVWDRGINKRDLTKGDGDTASTFPTFSAASWEKEYYSFDGSNDSLTGGPFDALPSSFTFTAAKSSASTNPSVEQVNSYVGTILDDISSAGSYTGYIHGMVLYDFQLTTIQEYHDEYSHLYWLWRGSAFGTYHRLITEGVCMLAMFGDSSTPYYDEVNGWTGTDTNVTTHDEDGLEFASANSNVEFADNAVLRSDEVTVAFYGTLMAQDGALIDKGTNYYVKIDPGGDPDIIVYFNTATITINPWSDVQHLAITAIDGYKPRYYVNGEYMGEGSVTVTVDDTDTTVVNIGNDNAKTDNYGGLSRLKQVSVFNKALTDLEVLALYLQAQWINEQY